MAITSQEQRAGFPLTLPLPQQLLEKPSWIKISQIRTFSVERIGRRMGIIPDELLPQVVEGLVELVT